MFVYGPPNFGEDRVHDWHGYVPVLRLDHPRQICALPEGDWEGSIAAVWAQEMQLFLPVGASPKLFYGRRVTVTAEPHHQEIASEYTIVTLDVIRIGPSH